MSREIHWLPEFGEKALCFSGVTNRSAVCGHTRTLGIPQPALESIGCWLPAGRSPANGMNPTTPYTSYARRAERICYVISGYVT